MIGIDGVPTSAIAAGCAPILQKAAEKTLLKWRWQPPTRNGEPVEARTKIAIQYQLEG
jgi:hypothetical protein